MKTNGNDLAYPFKVSDVQNYQHTEGGLTKREYFAGLAMASFAEMYKEIERSLDWDEMRRSGKFKDVETMKRIAEMSVQQADALIAELNEERKDENRN